MNKSELTAIAAEKAGITKKDAERLVNACLDTMCQALAAGEKVQISGFGTFEVTRRNPRVGRNPHTKEPVQIPAAKVPTFKASKLLRELVEK